MRDDIQSGRIRCGRHKTRRNYGQHDHLANGFINTAWRPSEAVPNAKRLCVWLHVCLYLFVCIYVYGIARYYDDESPRPKTQQTELDIMENAGRFAYMSIYGWEGCVSVCVSLCDDDDWARVIQWESLQSDDTTTTTATTNLVALPMY